MIRLIGANPVEKPSDWSLSSLGMNFASGYLEGLTTFDILKEPSPDTMPEYVARSLGSVLGFIGVGPWSLGGKMGLTAMGHTMELLGDATKATEYLTRAETAGRGFTFSIPSYIGGLGAKGTETLFQSSAVRATMSFAEEVAGRELLSQPTKKFARSLASGAAFMGFASAAAAKPMTLNPLEYFSADDFKTRANAFLTGIPYGIAQQGLASLITAKTLSKMGFEGFDKLVASSPDQAETILKSLRAISSGLSMAGYTAYKQDVPLEYTVYEGLLNGVFGYNQMPYTMKEANRLVNKHIQDPNTLHGNLIGQTGGDIVQFMRSKGESPSEGVQTELKLIYNHQWGENFARSFIPELFTPTVADKLGISIEELSKMPQAEISSLLKRPELEQLKSLQSEYGKSLFEDEVAKRIDNHTKMYGVAPNADEIAKISSDVYPAVTQQVGEETPNLIDWIQKTASRVSVAGNGNQTFIEKQMAINQSLSETGVSRSQMIEVGNAFKAEQLKGLDPLSLVSTIGKTFYENREAGTKEFGQVKKQIQDKLNLTFDDNQNKQVNTLWNMYANSIASNEMTYDIDNQKLVSKPAYNRAGTNITEWRGLSNYESEFGNRFMIIKDAQGFIGRNKTLDTIPIHETWRTFDKDGMKFEGINPNQLLQSIWEAGYNVVGNRKDDNQMLSEKRGDTKFDPATNKYTLDHKGVQYSTSLIDGFNHIDQAEREAFEAKPLADQAASLGIHYDGLDRMPEAVGKKAVPQFTDLQTRTTFNKNENETLLEALNRKRVQYGKEPIKPKNSYESYVRDRMQYVEDNTGKKYTDVSPEEQQYFQKAYDEMAGNRMVKWLALNQKKNLYDVFSSPGSTIRGAFPYTTRLQVLDNGNVAVDASVVGKEHYKSLLVELDPKTKYALRNSFGELEMSQYDGVTIGTKEVSADFARTVGTSEKEAFYKPTTGVSLGSGLLIQKHGYHQATEADEKALKEALGDFHMVSFNRTATKQAGDIPVVRLGMDENGKYYVTDRNGVRLTPQEIEMVKFNQPVSSVRLNPSVTEDTKMGNIDWLKQMQSNVPELSQHLFDTYNKVSFEGTQEENTKFDKLKYGEEVNIDNVHAQKILDAMQGPNFHKTPAQTLAIVDRLLSYHFDKGDVVEGEGEADLITELNKLRTSVSIAVAATGKENISAMFLRRPDIRNYLEQAMYKYLTDRVQRPEWKGFGHSSRFFYGLSPTDMKSYQEKNGTEFKQGDFLLGDELRQERRQVPAELKELFPGKSTVTLGEMWDHYQKTKSPLLADWFSRSVVTRSPQSDASGSRRGMLRGFMDGGGWGVALHPMDMKYLDGADMDGDAAKIYMGFDKKFVDHIDQPQIKHRFSRFFSSATDRDAFQGGDATKGLTIKQILSDPKLSTVLSTGKDASGKTYLEEFGIEKGHNPYLVGKVDQTFLNMKETYSMFSPGLLAEAGREATMGKFNLGWGLASANRGRELGAYLRGGSGRTVEVGEGNYYLRAKTDPEEFNKTIWDIVNSSADATKGKTPPVDHETMRVVGGVLSVADVFDRSGRPVNPQDFISFIKAKGMRQIPIVRELMDVDSNLRLRDYEGNKKHLQDQFGNLRQAVAKASDAMGNDPMKSVWYRSAELLSGLNYDPSPTDFTNMVTSDIVRRGIDRFIKSDRPDARYLLQAIGRVGVNFNNSYIDQTQMWPEIVRNYKGKMNSVELKNNFINPPGNDYRQSEAWKVAEKLPHPTERGKFIDKQDILAQQLAATSTKNLIEKTKLDPDKRTVSYELRDGRTKVEVLDDEDAAKAFINERVDRGMKESNFTIGRVQRTKGEQTKAIQELYMNDFIDINSLLLVNDHLSKYISQRLPKEELTNEAITNLIANDIQPFARSVSQVRDYLINTQKGIVQTRSDRIDPITNKPLFKTPSERATSYKYWEDALKKARDFKDALSPEKRNLFSALWLSSLNFNEISKSEIMDMAEKEFTKEGPKTDQPKKREVELIANRITTELANKRFDTYRGRTALASDIADPQMVKAYFKKWADLANSMGEDIKKLSMESIGEKLNISELAGDYPALMFTNPDFAGINTREATDANTRKFMAPLKQWYIESFGKDALGNIKNAQERVEWDTLVARGRRLMKDMPEQLEDFHLRFPEVMSQVYGTQYSWTPDIATKQDFKLYFDFLEGRKFDPTVIPKVKQSFFLMKFGAIARATQRYQEEITKFKFKYQRPVLTGEGPVNRQDVESVLSHNDMIYQAAQSHSNEANADEVKVRTFLQKILPMTETLDRQHNGVGTLMGKIAVAMRIEAPFADRKPEGGKTNLFRENYDWAVKKYNEIPDKLYNITSPDGKTVSMNKAKLLDYTEKGIRSYHPELRSIMYERPDDNLITYTGKKFGKQQIPEVDTKASNLAIAKRTIETGNRQPDISIKAQMELASWKALKDKAFDIYTTPRGIVFDSEMGTEQRTKFDEAVRSNVSGYTMELQKKFEKMTPAEQDAVMDQLYPGGNLAGFNLNERYDALGDSYWHHMTPNKNTRADYLRKQVTNMKLMSSQDAKNSSYRLLAEVRSHVSAENDPINGQEIMARLFDKGDPIRTMHIHPNAILGERNMEDPTPGWTLGMEAMTEAHAKLLKMQHDMLFAITSNYLVTDAREKSIFGEGTKDLVNFMERYARQTMGFQDVNPPEEPDSYNYGLKHNWFKYHSDLYWSKKLTQIGDSWFGGKLFPEYKQLAGIASQIKFKDEAEKKKWIAQSKQNLSEQKISWLSQTEAKWSLISLLTSGRTAITNITTAEISTFVNAGFDAYWRAKKFSRIQDEFGKDVIRNKGDVENMLENAGGLESQYANEWGMDPSITKATHTAATNLIREATKLNWNDAQIKEAIKDSNLMDLFVNKAAWFMRSSERFNRRSSMLAHQINAMRVFRQAGFELQYDDPWVVQIAREGVKASQFLYSNAERPAFMATAVGKMFHRFQLFTYNSVEFRVNVFKAAQQTGIGPGSVDIARFQRQTAADLFLFGMASLVPYSIFGSTLQAPYTGIQNALPYFFGTDDEKKKAFFSPLPYPANIIQPIIPPGLREIPQLFGLFTPGGDTVGKVHNAVVSWMPFQRIGKDIGRTIDNPAGAIDNLTGIPFQKIPQMQNEAATMNTFNQYINRYRDRSSLSPNKKNEQDIQRYIDGYPPIP